MENSSTALGGDVAHVVMFSGGVGSWAAAKRVAQQHGTDNLTLLFADTLIEDADLYRFLVEAAANVFRCAGRLDGIVQVAAATPPAKQADMTPRREHLARLRALVAPVMPRLAWIADGRTPWDVFRDERFLGNARVGLCSKILKQEMVDRWLDANREPANTVVHVGIDWSEEHRLVRLRERRGTQGWDYRGPLCDAPYLDKGALFALLAAEGIELSFLYRQGFSHNNCGGGCVRAGIGHFTHLYRTLPRVYAEWEANEQGLRGSDESFEHAVTELRRRHTRRLKLALDTFASAGFSLLPSPSVGEAKERTYQYDQHDKTKPRLSLCGMVRMLPTAQVTEGGYNKGGGTGRTGPVRPSLSRLVKLMPTPTSSEHKYRLQGDSQQSNGLAAIVQTLPPPVKLLPTAQARDHFPAHRPEYIAAKKASGHGMANLNDSIELGNGGADSSSTLASSLGSDHSRLSPLFVEWFMGWPIGWTDCDSPATDGCRWWARMRSALSRLTSASPTPSEPQMTLFETDGTA